MATRSNVSPGAHLAHQKNVLFRESETEAKADVLGMVAMSCGAGVVVTLLFAFYGLDLSIGFF
ncbi:hypothetical protein ACTGJ9_011665 [Bradyrhizobium sp. RDM12]